MHTTVAKQQSNFAPTKTQNPPFNQHINTKPTFLLITRHTRRPTQHPTPHITHLNHRHTLYYNVRNCGRHSRRCHVARRRTPSIHVGTRRPFCQPRISRQTHTCVSLVYNIRATCCGRPFGHLSDGAVRPRRTAWERDGSRRAQHCCCRRCRGSLLVWCARGAVVGDGCESRVVVSGLRG